MPFVSVTNNLFKKEDKVQDNTKENKEINTNKKDDKDTEKNAR